MPAPAAKVGGDGRPTVADAVSLQITTQMRGEDDGEAAANGGRPAMGL